MSGHYSFRMPSVKANVVQTTQAMAPAFRTRSVRALFHTEAECQGKRRPDGVCHGICLPDEECQGIIPSGHRGSRQMWSGWCVPQYLPSRQGVSGHYSLRTQSVKANVVWTTCSMASAFRTRSVRALFLPDAECQGKCHPDSVCHGVCLLEEDCQGICHPDVARILQTHSVKANFFQTQSVKANVVRTACATASAFWMRSVRIFAIRTQRVSYGCQVLRQFSSRLNTSRQMSGRRLRWHDTKVTERSQS